MTRKGFPQEFEIFADRAAWRAWLAANHAGQRAVWIQITKESAKSNGLRLSEAVEEALCFGWIDGQMYSKDQKSYVIRMTPRRPGSNWSKQNRERAEALIASGQMSAAGLKAIEQAKADGQWQNAYSAAELPDIPLDLRAALDSDSLVREQFHRWADSRKLSFLLWLSQSKRIETRTRRIAEIVETARLEAKNRSPLNGQPE